MTYWLQQGGPVLWLLIALSVLVVGRALERALFWRLVRQGDPARHPPTESDLARGLRLFATTATAAPMLGILGTVLGMIDVLGVLDANRAPDPLSISGGVAEALLTTAAGLVVALIALVAGEVCTARSEAWVRTAAEEVPAAAPRAAEPPTPRGGPVVLHRATLHGRDDAVRGAS